MKGGTQRFGKKLSKGQKTQIKQQKAGLLKRIRKMFNRKPPREYAPANLRLQWIQSLRSGAYKPHQGPRECARRVRQLAAGFITN